MPITAHRPEQRLVDLVGALRGHGMAHTRCAVARRMRILRQACRCAKATRASYVTCFAGCDAVDVLRELIASS
ncbi:hypothetical protein ACVOMT_22665 [Sphingomonas panni]